MGCQGRQVQSPNVCSSRSNSREPRAPRRPHNTGPHFPSIGPRIQHPQSKRCMPWVSSPEPGPRSRQAFKINKPRVSCLRSRLNNMFPLPRKGEKPQNPQPSPGASPTLCPVLALCPQFPPLWPLPVHMDEQQVLLSLKEPGSTLW